MPLRERKRVSTRAWARTSCSPKVRISAVSTVGSDGRPSYPASAGAGACSILASLDRSFDESGDPRAGAGVIGLPRPHWSRGGRGDGCFTPAMHRPSRSRPAGSAHYCFSTRRAYPRTRIERRGSAIPVIGSRRAIAGIASCPPLLCHARDRAASADAAVGIRARGLKAALL